MQDSLRSAGQIVFLIVWIFSFALLYYLIKTAVTNGVREANQQILESVKQIERSVIELNMRISKKESK
ncbi:hypothetical protein [Desulfosporosinus meridiei]|uniref:Uncharacterized protein n=1 Tax=Desulfosporosinus meridiei (strain ATCC BAA-275 / DSM 13257 / KCTC 12902 / NCIMB 13706 / S10) TaxID=768704 RepID=J7J5M1_DESMD|nr:hypothetical protein [Desulfosporosinus meridiei]AFQ46241.1 hypothetical protein Desmer_4435 [Desulfosporosinus meridiei DSM 13257]